MRCLYKSEWGQQSCALISFGLKSSLCSYVRNRTNDQPRNVFLTFRANTEIQIATNKKIYGHAGFSH